LEVVVQVGAFVDALVDAAVREMPPTVEWHVRIMPPALSDADRALVEGFMRASVCLAAGGPSNGARAEVTTERLAQISPDHYHLSAADMVRKVVARLGL
jgi:hypothetical protein